MKRRLLSMALAATFVALSTHPIRADVRSDQKTKVEFAGMLGRMFNLFGGKSAKEGVTTTVAVKGNRKASFNDATGQIIDLADEKLYDLDMKKKTYKVTTFAELRRQMEEAQKKAEEEARKEQAQAGTKEPAQQPDRQAEVDFDIKNTGQKKTINGFDTHQAVMTITVREKGKTLEQSGGLVMTADMWLAPSIKEMKEVAEFDMKYAQKLYGPVYSGVSAQQMATVMAMYPMMKDAVAKMNAEGGKIEGTPVMTVTTVDAVKSAEQIAAEEKQSSADSGSGQKPPTSVGGLLGGIARRAAAKKAAANDEGKDKSRATFMTTTSEVLKVVTNVTADDVAIPAGFKETK